MSDKDNVSTALIDFIRTQFLDGDPSGELDRQSPLLKWGVLDSLKTAILLNFIRGALNATIPPMELTARNFKDVDSITEMVIAAGGSVQASQGSVS